VKEDEVCVFNAIHLRDKLKALGFRFIAAQKAWCCPLQLVLLLSPKFQSADDVNLRLLLALSDADVGDLSGPWLKVVGTEEEVASAGLPVEKGGGGLGASQCRQYHGICGCWYA